MLKVRFYDYIEDELLKFAVIVTKSDGKWVFCKHKDRDTYECPGGHREPGEEIRKTAERELKEETGAIQFELRQVGVYSVQGYDGVVENTEETFGMLYFAEVSEFGALPDFEMECIELFDSFPDRWTYQEIQPKLIEFVKEKILPKA